MKQELLFSTALIAVASMTGCIPKNIKSMAQEECVARGAGVKTDQKKSNSGGFGLGSLAKMDLNSAAKSLQEKAKEYLLSKVKELTGIPKLEITKKLKDTCEASDALDLGKQRTIFVVKNVRLANVLIEDAYGLITRASSVASQKAIVEQDVQEDLDNPKNLEVDYARFETIKKETKGLEVKSLGALNKAFAKLKHATVAAAEIGSADKELAEFGQDNLKWSGEKLTSGILKEVLNSGKAVYDMGVSFGSALKSSIFNKVDPKGKEALADSKAEADAYNSGNPPPVEEGDFE